VRRPTAVLVIGSAVALGVFGLGGFAFAQFIATGRLVHLAQSFVPVVFGGWAVWVLAKAWYAWFREQRP